MDRIEVDSSGCGPYGSGMETKAEASVHRIRALEVLVSPGISIVAVTIVAAILRTLFLSSKSLWRDEATSAYRASVPLAELAQQVIGQGNINMGLYHLSLHFWTALAGSSEISLRALSVVCATATVPMVYAIGRELVDSETGLLAALLMAVNVTCILFAQQARAYAMIAMMVTLATLLFLRAIKNPSRWRCAGYTILGSACAYVHLFGSLVFPAHFVALFVFPTTRKTRLRLFVCLAIIAMFSLFEIRLAIGGDHGQVNWIPPTTVGQVLRLFETFAGLLWGIGQNNGSLLFLLYVASVAIAVIRGWKRDRASMMFLLSLVLLPIAIALVVSLRKPLFMPRYLFIGLPFFVLLAAFGLRQIQPRPMMASLAGLIVLLSLGQDRLYYHDHSREEWRGAIALLASESKPGDILIVFPEGFLHSVDYYRDRTEPHPAFRVMLLSVEQRDRVAEYTDVRKGLEQYLSAQNIAPIGRIWILTDNDNGANPKLKWLFDGHQIGGPPRLPGLSLFRYD